ncbi:MAG: hypothetical protein Q9P01_06285 [Anaerolineae bacterium]|nr:hypothetical protein [Anaerolineae bacterium]MDQ7034442.1 hypothetical protein [Anaerolineae bacterium]
MNAKIPDGKTRLLFVEGSTDKEFFIQLGYYLKFTKKTPLHILEYEGKDNLEGFLSLVQTESNFKRITHIGIVRDTDFTGGTLQSIQAALQNANQENPDRKQYPVPNVAATFVGDDDLRVGIFIMPDTQNDGMLESLILRVLDNDAIMTCVEQYFDCAEATEITLKPEPLPKAMMRVYMAALYQGRIRTFIEGKNIDFETPASDRNKSYLSDIYKMTWWTWNHAVFNDVKAFLLQLTDNS